MTKPVYDTRYYQNLWHKWDDMKSYGPMSRHVRNQLIKIIKSLDFNTVLDVGCGVGTLLQDIQNIKPKAKLNGTELFADSLEIAEIRLPHANLSILDLVKQKLAQKFDLTLCIDVFEHIPNDQTAMKHLQQMTKKYSLIVVPLGPLFEIETKRVGHVHGYTKKEFDDKLAKAGFEIIRSYQWGFPFYNLYRRILHRLPESTTTGKYTWKKKLTAELIYLVLGLSFKSDWGERYFVLAKPKNK